MKDYIHVAIYLASLVTYVVAGYLKIGDAATNYAILAAGFVSIGVVGSNAVATNLTNNSIAKSTATPTTTSNGVGPVT